MKHKPILIPALGDMPAAVLDPLHPGQVLALIERLDSTARLSAKGGAS